MWILKIPTRGQLWKNTFVAELALRSQGKKKDVVQCLCWQSDFGKEKWGMRGYWFGLGCLLNTNYKR